LDYGFKRSKAVRCIQVVKFVLIADYEMDEREVTEGKNCMIPYSTPHSELKKRRVEEGIYLGICYFFTMG
jgi:hypothetical protein